MDDACKNCCFYLKSEGECHRYPPRGSIKRMNVIDDGYAETVYLFPKVSPDDWCGEIELMAKSRTRPCF